MKTYNKTRVKGSEKSAEAICKTVAGKVPGLNAKVKSQKKAVVHIWDWDEQTTKEDILQEID